MHWIAPVILVLAVIIVIAGMTGAFLMRRHQLRAMLGTFVCDLRPDSSKKWVPGICRYSNDSLEFLKLWSLTPKPWMVLTRTSLEITSRREPSQDETQRAWSNGIVVGLDSDCGPVELNLGYAAYTGLSAWIEAGPVAGVGTWRQ